MEIYAIFNSETNVFQCALIQGQDYETKGDEQWQERMAALNGLFSGGVHTDDDWILTDEDDYNKYMLGTAGGDNGTGYIRDPETNHAVSAPAIEKTYEQEIAEAEAEYNAQVTEIKDDYLTAVLSDDDDGVTECKTRFQTATTEGDQRIKDIIDKWFNDQDGGDDNG